MSGFTELLQGLHPLPERFIGSHTEPIPLHIPQQPHTGTRKYCGKVRNRKRKEEEWEGKNRKRKEEGKRREEQKEEEGRMGREEQEKEGRREWEGRRGSEFGRVWKAGLVTFKSDHVVGRGGKGMGGGLRERVGADLSKNLDIGYEKHCADVRRWSGRINYSI